MSAVARNTVVSVRIEMRDAQGVQLSAPSDMTYLHGGYSGLVDALELALEGKGPGDSVLLQLEPEQAFGEYDASLLRVEQAARYGEGIAVGMEVEEDSHLYTVTDVADGKAVLDANHPLAGLALRFSCVILAVRAASEEEIRRGVSLP
ncbi:MAG TPA: peptidylprolyl isomerase [Burkholderiales bacterium]|nr:peptidylprolyl isomerase [Burkholderiales bacterium]